jgi:hypothetical protein
MYCDGTKKVFKCSSNPYFTFADDNEDNRLRPLKIKPCFDYVKESFTVEQFSFSQTNKQIINEGKTIFNFDFTLNPSAPSTYDLFVESRLRWTNLCKNCELNNDYREESCCVKIIWTKDEFIFGDNVPKGTYAFSRKRVKSGDPNNPCKLDCDELIIYLNQTDSFTGYKKGENDSYNFFFFNDVNEYSKKGRNWINFKAMLLHEIGHMFGFGHSSSDETVSDCVYNESIMSGYDMDDAGRDISEDDECMYKKMYCWEPSITSLKSNLTSNDFINTFPNPSSDKISLDLGGVEFADLVVYDILGNEIMSIQNYANKSEIDVSNLSIGTYTIQIQTSTGSISQRLLVNR